MLPGGDTTEVVTCDNDGEFAFCPVFTGEGNIPVREARLRSWYTREGILSVHFSLFGIFQAVDQVGSRNNLVRISILAQNKGFPFYGFWFIAHEWVVFKNLMHYNFGQPGTKLYRVQVSHVVRSQFPE